MTDTNKYLFNHTMVRVKDAQKSIKFYEDVFGMKLIRTDDFPEAKFTLYYLAFRPDNKPWTDREGVLELTQNYGTQDDDSYSVSNGNKDPKGYGHIAITVDNIESCCEQLEAKGVRFQKKLTDGRQKNIAFALDPDEYWVEIVQSDAYDDASKPSVSSPDSYHFHHTMIRIKDPKVSLKFYQEVLGMTLIRTKEFEAAKFTLYFLAYTDSRDNTHLWNREGVLELTWNWGTENEEGPVYHNGNDKPQGFGHICVSVDDLQAACKRLDGFDLVQWQKRPEEGRMKHIAFIRDPDNYWIELIAHEGTFFKAKHSL
ncbi:hypothetical protein CANCADRAFT_116574 [Tortispora caseinolytica NRRL Y-17796]|uniref:Lactoylglutathione lyase n=1 Tax=Tortispora caseinolytica NRRL Y-17796 TaxID=767744 RepID=A0A1E4THB2_9ASCO|nr:hypothetical protein CANCADRAFT_116574 [Tortispora caseinolytica NRRL Y-17796]